MIKQMTSEELKNLILHGNKEIIKEVLENIHPADILDILHEDEEFTRKLRISPEEVAQKLKSMSEKYGDLRVQEKIDEIQEKFKHIKRKTFVHRRLLNAFPNMRSAGSQRRDMHFQYIKKILKEKR